MSVELSEEEIFGNDIDPVDAIAAIRREEGNEEAAELLSRESLDNSAEAEAAPAEVEEVEEVVAVEETADETTEETADGEEETPAAEGEAEGETTDEVIKRKFKANGQDFEFSDAEIMDQFEGVFGKAMDYTQKMQKMAPYRKMISALEEESISQEQFDLALDVLKGDKSAIKKLANDRDIDLSDLSFDDEVEPYQAKSYGKSDLELEISEIENTISSDPEYSTTVDVIDRQWDAGSRQTIAANPGIITGLHHDIKSGVYAKVAPEAAKLQMLDGNSKSSLDYYLLAGADYQKSVEAGANQDKVDNLNKGAQEAETKFGKESSEAQGKRAASPTASIAGKKGVVDYLNDDNDEKFDAWYAGVLAKN
jgi:hypothetical protein